MKANRVLIVVASILILLLAGTLAGGHLYLEKQRARDTYFANTTINNYNMSELTAQQALDTILSDYTSGSVQINENNKKISSGKLEEYGYVVDEEKLLSSLSDCMQRQRGSFMDLVGSLMNGNKFTVTIPFTFYEETFNSQVCADAFPVERKASTNAEMLYDEKKNEYYIKPETYGNEFVDNQLRGIIRVKIDAFINENNPGSLLTIDFPDNIYIQPDVTQTDVTLNNTVNIYNSL